MKMAESHEIQEQPPKNLQANQSRSSSLEAYYTPQKVQASTGLCRIKHNSGVQKTNSPYYLNSTLLDLCFYPPMVREKMISWIFQQSSKRYLQRQTCYICITLMDLYWMRKGVPSINQVQLLGIACLNIACKFSQSSMKPLQSNPQTFSQQSLLNFQFQVFQKTNFKINPITCIHIAEHLIKKWDQYITKKITNELNPQNVELKNFVFLPPKEPLNQTNYLKIMLRTIQFYELLDCCIGMKQMLQYDFQDLVYNCFYVFLVKGKLFSAQNISVNNVLKGQIREILNKISIQSLNEGYSKEKWLFDESIQKIISIPLQSLQKHQAKTQSKKAQSLIYYLREKLTWASTNQLTTFQTWEPYYMKVIKQSSPQILKLQQSFQI